MRIAQVLLPPIDQQPQILDWFNSTRPECLRLDLHNSCGEWHLLAYFNWADQAVDLDLDLSTFGLDTTGVIWCREFWSSDYRLVRDGHWKQSNAQPHGTVLLAARSITDSSAQYLGSSFHISQGLEVSEFTQSMGKLAFKLERPGKTQGEFLLRLPAKPNSAHGNGKPLDWSDGSAPDIYHFTVEIDRECTIEVLYSN